MKTKLKLYKPIDINNESEIIKHNNAFILPNGAFFLAKGYTGCNPSHQLESSALTIIREEIKYDIKKEECANYFNDLGINYQNDKNDKVKRFNYLRSVLVHYYGYVLFARQEIIENHNNRNRFFDCSLIPNPNFYDKHVTSLQVETLKLLFELNNDETMCYNFMCKSNDEVLKKVLEHDEYHSSWHR